VRKTLLAFALGFGAAVVLTWALAEWTWRRMVDDIYWR